MNKTCWIIKLDQSKWFVYRNGEKWAGPFNTIKEAKDWLKGATPTGWK